MVELRKTERFARWLDDLCDVRGRPRIPACGGSKHSQAADIKTALQLARGLAE